MYIKVTLNICIGEVFKAVVSLYARDKTSPLPSLDEVLICNHETTVEEVQNYMHALCLLMCVYILL